MEAGGTAWEPNTNNITGQRNLLINPYSKEEKKALRRTVGPEEMANPARLMSDAVHLAASRTILSSVGSDAIGMASTADVAMSEGDDVSTGASSSCDASAPTPPVPGSLLPDSHVLSTTAIANTKSTQYRSYP